MANVGTVNIGLVANTAKWSSGFKKARKEVSGFQGFMQSASSNIGKLFAGAFAVGAVVKITKELHSVAMGIDDLATQAVKLGVSTRELDAMRHSANLLDTDFKTLETSIVKLKKNLYDASIGMKEQADAFKALGLSINDLKTLSVRDQLDKTFQALRNVRNETDQTALTMKLFGKSGASLLPIIRSNAEGFSQFYDEAFKVNEALEDTSKIDAYDIAMKRLSYTWENFKRTVVVGAASLLPTEPGDDPRLIQQRLLELEDRQRSNSGGYMSDADYEEFKRLTKKMEDLRKQMWSPVPVSTQSTGNKTPLFNMWRAAISGVEDFKLSAIFAYRDIGRAADLFQHEVMMGWQRQREALEEQAAALEKQIQIEQDAQVSANADILRTRGAPSAMERGGNEAFNTLASAIADMRGGNEAEKLLRANNVIARGSQDELRDMKRELEDIRQKLSMISTEGLN